MFEKLPETSISEALKKAGLKESSPSEIYKDNSPEAGFDKPSVPSEKVEVAPSSVPAPSKEKAVVDDEVLITGAQKGDPTACTTVMKVLDDKSQVVSHPNESISEKTFLEDLFKRSLACSSEQHDIFLQLQGCYEVCIFILLHCP